MSEWVNLMRKGERRSSKKQNLPENHTFINRSYSCLKFTDKNTKIKKQVVNVLPTGRSVVEVKN